jgi:transketolase
MDRLAAICIDRLLEHSDTDRRIWVLDGDLADSYRATDFAARRPDRFIMAGIAEQNMVSMAAGMAACGARPWVFSFAAFLAYRAADQIRMCVSQTRLPVVLVASHAGGCGGRNGKTHQAISDLSVVGGFPGIDIWTPADAADVEFAVRTILREGRGTYVRAPRDEVAALPGLSAAFRSLTGPGDVLIVANGLASHWALDVHHLLGVRSISTEVLNVIRLSPFAPELISRIQGAAHWFVIEDHVRHGGMGDMVSRAVGRQPTRWFGWPDGWSGGSGSSAELRGSCGLDSRALRDGICDALSKRG